MKREWVDNYQPSEGEILLVSLVVFCVLAAVPVLFIFFSMVKGSDFDLGPVCCTTLLLLSLVGFVICWSITRGVYKQVTRVGFDQDGIMLSHRSKVSTILKWDEIRNLTRLENQTRKEYQISYLNKVSGILTFENIDAKIAHMIIARKKLASIPEDRRFCPRCGKQNEGLEFCLDCGTSWD
ncbi:MAG: hypothetical protein Q7J68_03330 [Thermoplasmata archaeon]|nr:hypothetical protein [Thermoplasmata archaeon]